MIKPEVFYLVTRHDNDDFKWIFLMHPSNDNEKVNSIIFCLCRLCLVDSFFRIARERSIKFIVVLYVNLREKPPRKCMPATMCEIE